VETDKMIYHLRNARTILSHHPDGLAFPFVADYAPKFGDSAEFAGAAKPIAASTNPSAAIRVLLVHLIR
jgi:hypothetical protein